MSSEELVNFIKHIAEKHNLGIINKIEKINFGFNRIVLNLNDKYVLKITDNPKKFFGANNEIKFYLENNFDFTPKMIGHNNELKEFPFIYILEERLNGNNLFDIWSSLSKFEQEEILIELINILKTIHFDEHESSNCLQNLFNQCDENFEKIVDMGILSGEKLEYLSEVKKIIPNYFLNTKICKIHGDLHFNNIMLVSGKVKILDFEKYELAPIDKEFDSIIRMVNDPNSLIKNGIQNSVVKEDYELIIEVFKKNYSEVFEKENFEERVIIYQFINALKWLSKFPNHEPYHDVLFNKSKVLIKRG